MEDYKEVLKKQYYTSKDVAIIFDIPEQTIRDWIVKGDLKAVKLGKRWFLPISQFEVRED